MVISQTKETEPGKYKCQICGLASVKVLYKKDKYNIVKCDKCSFIFNDSWQTFAQESDKTVWDKIILEAWVEIYDSKKKGIP